MKLEDLIAKRTGLSRNAARIGIVAGEAQINGAIVTQHHREIDRFCRIEFRGKLISAATRSLYIMLHKPAAVVSATSDPQHRTVIDLIDDPDKHTLHIAGRLDRNTTGLVLLTNDGRWSKQLMLPGKSCPKVYHVETRDPIPADTIARFAAGFYFATENITTRPAQLEILSEKSARLTLHEGRYHQVKRMFHRAGNRVTALHRESIGPIVLPPDLKPGEWRMLDPQISA